MKKTILISLFFNILLCFIAILPSKAQLLANKIKLEVKDISLNQADTTIVIKYDLKAAKRRYYNTKLFYSNNGGNSFKGPLRSIQGAIGDSSLAGNNQSVAWSFRKDNPYFDGKNIMFKIEAAEVPKIANGGPEKALLSLLVPGLGDGKVRNGYNYFWITGLSYGCLATSAILFVRSESKYDDYLSRIANTEQDHQSLYNTAKNSQDWARGFLIAGASIWAADVIAVYFRGLKNRHRIQREREKEEAEKNESAFFIEKPKKKLFTPQIIPSTDGRFSQVSLLLKF